MRRSARTLLFPLLLLLCSQLPVTAAGSTLLVLGDSISAGRGVPAGSGWVDLLRERLQREGDARMVINASISGETSEGGRARLPSLLQQYRPSLVMIELGGNDGLRGFPPELIRRNIEQMIDTARDAGARVLLLGMRIPPNYGPRYTDAFHRIYTEVAREKDVALVPFLLEGIATLPELMQEDGIHPNLAAQPRILQNVLPALPAAETQ